MHFKVLFRSKLWQRLAREDGLHPVETALLTLFVSAAALGALSVLRPYVARLLD